MMRYLIEIALFPRELDLDRVPCRGGHGPGHI